MNRPSLLHIVERLEGFLGRLPETIRRPILHELTPLKELFLQQRPPRLALIGSQKVSLDEILSTVFGSAEADSQGVPTGSRHWHEVAVAEHATISVLDLRGSNFSSKIDIAPDVVFFVEDAESLKSLRKASAHDFAHIGPETKIVALSFAPTKRASRDGSSDEARTIFEEQFGDRFLGAFGLHAGQPQKLLSILARSVPNEARIEMIRISRDRETQHEVAQILVKSTTAICTAIGAQPIPLADLPILTTLQLVMVSGIMYVSGRERSLRAATEFIGALGANVGVGMLFREGTRALLKFFPGWGNIICGMVAGAGTYAIGRAAIVYFLEGVSLKDARRVYLKSKKERKQRAIEPPSRPKKTVKGQK